MAIWRYTDAPPDLSGYATTETVAQLDKDLNLSTSQWLAYIAAQNAEQSGGTSFSRVFEGTGALPATMYQDARVGLGVKDSALQATYGFVANNTYTFWALDRTPLLTDDFSVVVTLRGNTSNNAPTYILARSNSDVTEAVCCRVSQTSMAVGKIAWVAGVPQFDAWSTFGYSSQSGAMIEFRGSGNNFTVKVNGLVHQSFTYGGTHPIDDLHRFVGTAFRQANGLFFGTNTAPVTSFTASDIAVPATLGTGWDLYRANTAGVSKPSGDSYPSGTALYDNIRRASNCTVTLGTGAVQIKRAGWYTCTVRMQYDSEANLGVYIPLLYGMDLGDSTPTMLKSGQPVSGSVNASQGTFEVYREVGQWLFPGAYTPSGRTVVGDTNGRFTYWSGALSRS